MAWRNAHAPHLYVTRPELEPGAWLSRARLFQAEQAHQVMELTVMHVYNPSFPQRWRTPAGSVWAENSPVHVRYGWWADDSGDFYGYVASSRVQSCETDPRVAYAVQVPVVYTLVGSSMPLQTRKNRMWIDMSASGIARQIARENNLQPIVERTAVRFAQRLQSSSDWIFLADISDQIGYRLYVDNSALWFVDRMTVMPASDGSVPRFWQRKQPGVIDSVREFDATLGDTDPAGGPRPRFDATAFNRSSNVLTDTSYAHPRTTLLGKPVEPVLRAQYSDRPAESYNAARRLLDADTEWLWNESRATVNGDPRLKPGTLVSLQGAGLGDTNTGTWMVRSATHTLDINHLYRPKSTYTCSLVLGRDNTHTLDLKVQSMARPYTPTVLVGGRWRAESTGETL
ncbi:hypothetical protein ABZ543_12935 [Streptomyces roseifaciens]